VQLIVDLPVLTIMGLSKAAPSYLSCPPHNLGITIMKKLGLLVMVGVLFCGNTAAIAMNGASDQVTNTVVLDASPTEVWDAIKAARSCDPAHRHVVSNIGPDYVVEETFNKIPMLGNVSCKYKEHEIADKKLQYSLISSDKFVAFNGEWELCPLNSGKQTALKLSSFVDTGIKLPFADKITRDSTKKSIDGRLAEVKNELTRSKTY
jgi:hypothetical protein